GTGHETAPGSVRTKAQVMDYLKGSFASLHRAAAALNESNMDAPIPSKGNRTRLLLLIDALVHSSNHYGQMVGYLRMNSIVPPASRSEKLTKAVMKGESHAKTTKCVSLGLIVQLRLHRKSDQVTTFPTGLKDSSGSRVTEPMRSPGAISKSTLPVPGW